MHGARGVGLGRLVVQLLAPGYNENEISCAEKKTSAGQIPALHKRFFASFAVETENMRATIQQKEEQKSKRQVAASVAPAPAPAPDKTLKTIYCEICGAGFAAGPANEELLAGSPDLLESAFMSVCHYCFRCRRPACPACWDRVHGVCGACVEEAQLPFRSQAPMLNGVVFPPLRQPSIEREERSTFFACVRPGRFQMQHRQSPLSQLGDGKQLKFAGGTTPNTFNAPQKPLGSYAHSSHLLAGLTRDEQARPAHDAYQAVSPALDALSTASAVACPAQQVAEQAENADAPQAISRFAQAMDRFERVLIILFLFVLLVVVAMIVAAEISVQANMLFAHWLRIDIRSEIAYWLSWAQQLHW